MNDNVVITFTNDIIKPMTDISIHNMEKYAKKIGAVFMIISKNDFTIFDLSSILIKYKRMIYFNPNILIRDDCPNLFDIVDDKKIGLYNEGSFQPRFEHMYLYSKISNDMVDDSKWNNEFYNLGVIVCSRIHNALLKYPKKIHDIPLFYSSCITTRIINNEVKVHELDYKFNRLPFLDTFVGQSRLDSYILQYDTVNISHIINVMNYDLQYWKEGSKSNYYYQKRIVFKVGGGMGDQLCAEPTIRYCKETIYKNDEINIITNWPELFKHLNSYGINVYIDDTYLKTTLLENPIRVLETMPNPKSEVWRVIPHTIAHGVDFCSISSIHRMIPDSYKEFKLSYSESDLKELLDIVDIEIIKRSIVIHPGKGWKSKTFPKEWWDSIINTLSKKGYNVIIIGKYISENQGYVDVDIPEGVIDLRDILSLPSLFALLDNSPILISNDSAPVHIAGAFNNWIILIPTCKHPDNVLPYRKGSKNHKTMSLYKKLTFDDIDSTPTRLSYQTLDWVNGDILDYLPEPKDVIDNTINIMESILFYIDKKFNEDMEYFKE